MKTVYVRLFTIFALAALACGVQAQAADEMTIKVDHDFVVLGKTLPAGTYKVFRVNTNDNRELVISSFENHTGAIVVATEVEANRRDETHAKFEVLGDQYVLTQIETLDHVFTIPVSKTVQAELVARHSTTPSSVNSGSN